MEARDRRGAGRAAHRGPRRHAAARPAAGRRAAGVRGVVGRARRRAWSRSPPRAVVLATGGIGGLYAVTTNPAELKGEGLALAALAGARDRRPRVRAVPPDRHRHRPRSRAAGHRGPARRGRGAGRTAPAGASWPATIRTPSSRRATWWPAPSIAEIAAGRGAFLDAREARRRALSRGVPGRVRRLPGRRHRPAQPADPGGAGRHYHMGGIATDARGPHLAAPASTPPANAPRPACTAPTAWPPTPCWRPRCSARARRRPAGPSLPEAGRGPAGPAADAAPGPRPPAMSEARAPLAPPDDRQGRRGPRPRGPRDACREIDAMAAQARTPGLVATAPPRADRGRRALARTESRGGQFRADCPDRTASRPAHALQSPGSPLRAPGPRPRPAVIPLAGAAP